MPALTSNGKVIVVSPLVEVSGTTPEVIFTCMPPYLKYIIRKLTIYNKDSADHEVILGAYNTTAPSWSEDKLIYKVLAGQIITLGPDDLPEDFVMTSDPATAIMAWAAKLDAAVTANNVYIKAEFEVA